MVKRNIKGFVLLIVGVFICEMFVFAAEDAKGTSNGSNLVPEHFAWAYTGYYYLDGPKFEASCPLGRPGAGLIDADGNVWFGTGGNAMVGIGGRCVMNDGGMVRPFFGDDYWTSDFDVDEGPGSGLCTTVLSSGLGRPRESQFVWGSTLQGGDKGFLLFSDSVSVKKVWKNPEQGYRWWFKKIIGGGKKSVPKAKGATIVARDVGDTIKMVQVMPDGKIVVFCEGGFYEYKDNNLICLIGYDDYKDQCDLPLKAGKKDVPALGVLSPDGTCYLGTYFSSGFGGKSPCIWRIKPGGQLEAYAWAIINKHLDGPAMYSGSMCGHHIWARMHNYQYLPANCLFIMAHDEFRIRRIIDGRLSSLGPDGEWREWTKKQIPRNYRWFHTWAPGPNGMVTMSSKCKGSSTSITMVLNGVEWSKPTIGEPITAPVSVWPRDEKFKTLREKIKNKKNKGNK